MAWIEMGDREIARNEHIIRRRDESDYCPSEGFFGARVVGNDFVLEQQNCSGWFFIQESMMFRDSEQNGEFLLSEYRRVYLDRREPDADPMEVRQTVTHFGVISFAEVDMG